MDNNKLDLLEQIARLSRIMRRRSTDGNTITHVGHKILRIVGERNGIRTTDLADEIGIRPASMTDALKRLEEEGYIARNKDENDSRAIKVLVTEKAVEQKLQWEAESRERNDQLCACLSEDELKTFGVVCDKLCAFIEEKYPHTQTGHKHDRGNKGNPESRDHCHHHGHGHHHRCGHETDGNHSDNHNDNNEARHGRHSNGGDGTLTCPQCRKHCEKENLQCDKGRDFFQHQPTPEQRD